MPDDLKTITVRHNARRAHLHNAREQLLKSARGWNLWESQIEELETFIGELMATEADILNAAITVIGNLQNQLATASTTTKSTADLAAEQTAEANPLIAAILNPTPAPSTGATSTGTTTTVGNVPTDTSAATGVANVPTDTTAAVGAGTILPLATA